MAESVYRLQIPQGYTPALDILETEKAIKILRTPLKPSWLRPCI